MGVGGGACSSSSLAGSGRWVSSWGAGAFGAATSAGFAASIWTVNGIESGLFSASLLKMRQRLEKEPVASLVVSTRRSSVAF